METPIVSAPTGEFEPPAPNRIVLAHSAKLDSHLETAGSMWQAICTDDVGARLARLSEQELVQHAAALRIYAKMIDQVHTDRRILGALNMAVLLEREQ